MKVIKEIARKRAELLCFNMKIAFSITKKELLDATGVALVIANILTGVQGYRFGAHQGEIIKAHPAGRGAAPPLVMAPLVSLNAVFRRVDEVADNMCRQWNSGNAALCGKAALPNGKPEFSNVEMILFNAQLVAEGLTIVATAPGSFVGSTVGYIAAGPQ